MKKIENFEDIKYAPNGKIFSISTVRTLTYGCYYSDFDTPTRYIKIETTKNRRNKTEVTFRNTEYPTEYLSIDKRSFNRGRFKVCNISLYSSEEIVAANVAQNSNLVHPLTCGGGGGAFDNRDDCPQNPTTNQKGQLIASINGFICPCGLYNQEIPQYSIDYGNQLIDSLFVGQEVKIKNYPTVAKINTISKHTGTILVDIFVDGLKINGKMHGKTISMWIGISDIIFQP